MDTITHLIRMARLEASLDKRCLLAGATTMDVPRYGEGKAAFHVLLDGVCTLELPTRDITLRAGDVVVLPNGEPHRVRTDGTGRPQGVVDRPGHTFDTVRSREGEEVIDLFCGHYSFGRGAGAMLFQSLPDPLYVSFGPGDGNEVVRMLSTIMRQEAKVEGPGAGAVLSSLCSALLAMVLRKSDRSPSETTLWTAVDEDWIRAVMDAVLREPGVDWSVAGLARVAGMSRATFARHFPRRTGMTVGAFLTHIRLMVAADLLTDSDLTVAAVAAEVGYHSESAFSRAFHRATGSTPARFRRAGGSRRPRPESPPVS